MNLAGLFTQTTVTFQAGLEQDWLTLNGRAEHGAALDRVSALLERVRRLAGKEPYAHVESHNNFPTGTGIASSASAFAALALAASRAAGLELAEAQLSRLARTASGSAARSVPGGFVEWIAGEDDDSSYAYTIAPAEYWDLVDCVAIVSRAHKPTGSQDGHPLADTSRLQSARVADAPRRLSLCRQAILRRDFEALAAIAEVDSNMMHAVMMTSNPVLIYWQPATLAVMHAVVRWRGEGLPVFYTIDAGPNVHVITQDDHAAEIANRLREIPGVQQVISAHPGGPARVSIPT